MANPKVAFYTLGCKVNQNETEALGALFKEHNYQVVDFDDVADVYVINTCTVTHLGDRKSRQIIRRAIHNNPQALIVVTGCYAQTSPGEVAKIPGVDLIIGTRDRARMVELVQEHQKGSAPESYVNDISKAQDFENLPVDRLINRTRAYLKVQEGCEQFCTYCIIPYARGPSRSRSVESALNEAGKLVEAGFKELILTGIHLGYYGKDLGGNIDLVYLCRELLAKTGIQRLRLSSIESTEISDELIDLMAEEPRFCPHLHIPLQSGDDDILKAMHRPYTTDDYRKIVEKLRTRIPDIGISADIMVGFPGEREENFAKSYAFVKEMGFMGLHVFKYSPRKGTPASEMTEQVSAQDKEKRSKEMLKLAEQGFRAFARKYIDKTMDVLVETTFPQGGWEGHTANFIRVVFPGETEKGAIVPVKLKKIVQNYVQGQLDKSRN
ncbi:MAG: tRNA (N(6)-L-threonylcarbamoyladenosine(37)-C(2))-methylthiotransferase MtaB [Clostridia bacterium]|nr:tRNA (N(6)-L-threonylcarbamoyladenosine(37)-C(2))-methylthiotransferase MtaB [Clostridia bacterium]